VRYEPQTTRAIRVLAVLAVLVVLAQYFLTNGIASADIAPEVPGKVEKLTPPFRARWVWVSDLILERMALLDVDSGEFLGLVNGGYGPIAPLFPSKRPEIYVPTTYYSRRTRGDRIDLLEIYDAATLAPVAEVQVPGKRATDAVALGHSAMSDDDKFVALFNWTPRTSLSIVDAEQRTFAGEVEIPGCSLVYGAGPRRFFSLCADGAALVVTLDDAGKEVSKTRTPSFFDPQRDPVTEKAVRYRDQWLFVSFDGHVHPVDVSAAAISFAEPWSLLNEGDRDDTWRIGGLQHLAVHQGTGRLYSLVHRGGPDTHKEAGEEVWVYDLAKKQRVARIHLRNPGFTIYGFPVEFWRSWVWPFNALSDWVLDTVAPAMVTHIEVTQDPAPRLLTASQYSGAIGVYDALSGTFVSRVQPTGWTSDLLVAPWKGQ
jgi:methylamine dehydrogenase heavy chain